MTITYHRILVGVDGSELAHKAFEQAVEVAKRNDAELFIAHVIANDNFISPDASIYAKMITMEKDRVKEQLAANVRYANNHGLQKVTPILTVASPKKEIAIRIPEEYQIDLIMLGITGKGVIERMLMGSVAQYVSVHAKANVLLVKG